MDLPDPDERTGLLGLVTEGVDDLVDLEGKVLVGPDPEGEHGVHSGLGCGPGDQTDIELILSCVYLVLISKLGIASTVIYIPFVKTSFDIGILYYVIGLLFLVGFSNAVNLTDGLDGLCAGVTVTVAVFFSVFAAYAGNPALRLIALSVLGGCGGFLLYNFHPAKVSHHSKNCLKFFM